MLIGLCVFAGVVGYMVIGAIIGGIFARFDESYDSSAPLFWVAWPIALPTFCLFHLMDKIGRGISGR